MSQTVYSLYDLARGVADTLKAWGVPIVVKLGAKPFASEMHTENEVVFEATEDTYHSPARAGGNPRPISLCHCGAVATIRGRTMATGAKVVTHREAVRVLLEYVQAAMVKVGGEHGIRPTFETGKWVDDDDQGQEYGAKYLLLFNVPEHRYAKDKDTAAADFSGSSVMVIGGTEYTACGETA